MFVAVSKQMVHVVLFLLLRLKRNTALSSISHILRAALVAPLASVAQSLLFNACLRPAPGLQLCPQCS